jgi:hypothetical protein
MKAEPPPTFQPLLPSNISFQIVPRPIDLLHCAQFDGCGTLQIVLAVDILWAVGYCKLNFNSAAEFVEQQMRMYRPLN